ncbi:MAG: penicillin acylase family protein, partial [Thermoflexus sp.]
MGQRFRSRTLLSLLLIGLLLSGLALWGWARVAPPASLIFHGPDGPVVLHRVGPAQWRIEAFSHRDEAFAEGVLDGLDAAPLLIFRRAAAYGKLEALIGPEAAIADAWVQAVDLPARAHQVWEQLDEETRARLQAYADGVNTAWRMGPFLIRRLPQPDPLPGPWRPSDSVAVAVGLALAHPGWIEAEISAALQPLPAPLRKALEDPSWRSAPRLSDAPMREAAWRTWAAVGAAPEIGLFRGCRDGDGFRLHAMAAPVLPLPWRVIWVGEEARVRWPGLPGAPARATSSGGRWLKPAPGPGDPLHALGELIRGVVKDEAFRAFWEW